MPNYRRDAWDTDTMRAHRAVINLDVACTRAQWLQARKAIAEGLVEVRRRQGRKAARRERDHLRFVNTGPWVRSEGM